LLSDGFKDVFRTDILPLILKSLREHGLFVAGWPGVGKTQLVKMLAMLLGRYWIDVTRREYFTYHPLHPKSNI
jgi:MoxR-like ATPase